MLGSTGQASPDPALAGMALFSQQCFSPFLTADRLSAAVAATDAAGLRVDFYDLTPFSDVAPSPILGRAGTVGTDRRCEVAFDGAHGDDASDVAGTALAREGIVTPAPLPQTHASAKLDGTTLLAARYLNPIRVAVVHTGTRQAADGATETFLMVERLTPAASALVGK